MDSLAKKNDCTQCLFFSSGGQKDLFPDRSYREGKCKQKLLGLKMNSATVYELQKMHTYMLSEFKDFVRMWSFVCQTHL